MKIISIDDGSENELNSIGEIEKCFEASASFDVETLSRYGVDTIYVYIDPFNDEIHGKRVLDYALTEEEAKENCHQSYMDI